MTTECPHCGEVIYADDFEKETFEATGQYRWAYAPNKYGPTYHYLVGPDGEKVFVLTDPEDREPQRDLEPLLPHLAKMRAKIEELTSHD